MRGLEFLVFSAMAVIFLAVITAAAGSQLYCLTEGQTIKFSQCNPSMEDKTCDSTTCQICATEVSSGVYCPASFNSCEDSCVKFEDTKNEPEPVITLLSPAKIHIEEQPKKIDFKYEVTQASTIKTCSLVFDGDVVITSTARIQSRTNKLSYLVTLGHHFWQIECSKRNSAGTVTSEERSITVGNEFNKENETQNKINLLSPGNGFSSAGTQEIQFSFETSNSSALKECSLLINENIVATTSSKIISYTVNPGSYSWKIECKDKSGKTFSSEARGLNINSPDAGSGGSSGGGSGGGGGGGGGGSVSRPSASIVNNTNNTNANNKIIQLSSGDKDTIEELETKDLDSSPGVTGTINKFKLTIILIITLIIASVIFFIKKKK